MGPYSPPLKGRRSSLLSPDSPMTPILMPLPAHPVSNPVLHNDDWARLQEHHAYLENQLELLQASLPNKADKGGSSDSGLSESDSDNSDDESDTEAPPRGKKAADCPEAVKVNTKYFNDLYARFEECRRLNHLPTLNLIFQILEAILLIGHKRSLGVILRKNNLPKLLTAMQFNPSLNSTLVERPDHLDCLGTRRCAVPLPLPIADLAVSVYQMGYLRDTIIPVVCDEARYLNLNIHIMQTKSKLCQSVFDDRRLLPGLFAELRGGGLGDARTVEYLRFLKEFLELGISSYPGDGAYFWRGVLRDHDLVPLLTDCLGSRCEAVRRVAVDLCLVLCDEESRKILYTIIPQNPNFLRRLFDVFSDTGSEDGTVLQLQATLPMLVANPHTETVPIFYSSAKNVVNIWIDLHKRENRLPPSLNVGAFMELLSLALHHHYRTFYYDHPECITTLIDFISILWKNSRRLPNCLLVATNKAVLSILHLANDKYHNYLADTGVFCGVLKGFSESNNLVTSSILTLLHTILQLEIHPLIEFICRLWFASPDPEAVCPLLTSTSFVQQLFQDRHQPSWNTPPRTPSSP